MEIVKGATWKKASRSSGGSSNCVEVANLGDKLAVRDSKNPDGGLLVLDGQARARFMTAIRAGRLSR